MPPLKNQTLLLNQVLVQIQPLIYLGPTLLSILFAQDGELL